MLRCLFSSQQKEMDKAKGQRDYEEKMIVSAWYNMVQTPHGHEPIWGRAAPAAASLPEEQLISLAQLSLGHGKGQRLGAASFSGLWHCG